MGYMFYTGEKVQYMQMFQVKSYHLHIQQQVMKDDKLNERKDNNSSRKDNNMEDHNIRI